MAREPRQTDGADRESFGHWVRQWPAAHNWLLAGLGVVTILGLIGAYITQRALDNPGSEEPVGATAVAGERPGQKEVVLSSNGFQPADLALASGETLAIRNDTDEVCQLQLDGTGFYALDPGDSTAWHPGSTGRHTFHCDAGPSGRLQVDVS